MVLGALIDLGVEPARLQGELEKLNLPGWRMTSRSVNKNGITATKVDVLLQGAAGAESLADEANTEVHDHGHHHHDVHDHDNKHEPHSHEVHRPLRVILDLLAQSDLHPLDKERATKIFTRLGEAEAKVHGVPLLDVHFHEVGGVDAIVDVVGACIGLRLLDIDRIHVSPIHVGSGFVKMAHGLFPIPAPATANLLVGAPAYATELKGELITPTGAAILTTLADGFGPMPQMVVRATGYGAGTRDREIPNVLRMVVGEQASPSGAYKTEVAVMIEATIDDMNPEFYEHVLERLLSAGAMDVFLAPVQMKKGRPGNVLHVLIAPDLAQQAVGIIFAETSTIGVRTYPVVKKMLEREIITVATPFGQVGVKVARSAGKVLNVAPEYADCKAIAREQGVPLKVVYQAAQSAAAAIQ
jgi:uncharacterized protein (TIGR00299 family) protein